MVPRMAKKKKAKRKPRQPTRLAPVSHLDRFRTPAWHYCLRPVPDHPGYFVSIDGHIWSLRRVSKNLPNPVLQRLATHRLKMRDANGRSNNCFRNRLIASIFLGEIPEGQFVGYRDGDRHNCAASNLVFVTRREAKSKSKAFGERIGQNKLTARSTRG